MTSKFKKKLWYNKEIKEKRKFKYYKEVIKPNLEDKKYVSLLPNLKKKIDIVKIRTNSIEIPNET
jgi:hypothetical protein